MASWLRPCSHWKIQIIGAEQKVHNFTTCPLMVVGARSDWTGVALFPPVLPELAAWSTASTAKITWISKEMFIGIKHNTGWGCQLLPFSAVCWSVTILSRCPPTFNITLFEFWRPLTSPLVPLRLIPPTITQFTLHFIWRKVKVKSGSLIHLFQPN